MDKNQIVGLLKGIVTGFAGKDIKEAEQCLSEVKAASLDIYTVIQELEEGIKSKSVKEILKALGDIYAGVEAVKTAMDNCKEAAADWEQLKEEFTKAIQLFKESKLKAFEDIGKAIILDRSDITQQVKNMISDYKSKNYSGIGNEVGQILREILDDTLTKLMKNFRHVNPDA